MWIYELEASLACIASASQGHSEILSQREQERDYTNTSYKIKPKLNKG